MSGLLYTRYELVRAFRNRRFFFFSLGFPLILFFIIAGPQSGDNNFAGSGIPAALFYMAGLLSFGTMSSMISTGARIAGERQAGWTRQLRVTPLSTRAYFRAKVLTAYAMAALTIAALYLAGASLGVSLPAEPVAGDDRPHPDRAAAVRRAWDRARAPAQRRLDRTGDRRPDGPAGARRWHVVPGDPRVPA